MADKPDDDALFRALMAAEGVRPADGDGPGRVTVPPRDPASPPPRSPRLRAVEKAVQEKRHARLVANASASARAEGTAPLVPLLVLERRGEEVAARADGVDKRTWRKLAQGDFAVAAELDLHGQTGAIAEERTVRFVVASRAAGHQAVAVVHGRGLHSGQEGPVLKDRVLALLTEGPVREHVLALASAPWRLGGPGVTLVLLRTKR